MIEIKRPEASRAAELARLRGGAVDAVNAATGAARCRFITPIPGQEMIYLEKEREAAAYVASDPEPVDLAGFGYIAADVRASGMTPYQVAQVILYRADAFRRIGAVIEDLRGATLARIAAADAVDLPGIVAGFELDVSRVSG